MHLDRIRFSRHLDSRVPVAAIMRTCDPTFRLTIQWWIAILAWRAISLKVKLGVSKLLLCGLETPPEARDPAPRTATGLRAPNSGAPLWSGRGRASRSCRLCTLALPDDRSVQLATGLRSGRRRGPRPQVRQTATTRQTRVCCARVAPSIAPHARPSPRLSAQPKGKSAQYPRR
jgi:hypothetical protein